MSPLVGHWPLTEDSGSTANDHSGNGNDGTANGAGPSGTGTVSGPLGTTAYDFDGSDDRVELPDLGLTSSKGFSISLWVNQDDTATNAGSSHTYVARYDGTDDILQLAATQGGGSNPLRFDCGHAGGNRITVTADGEQPVNTWAHVVGVFDSSGPTVTLYKNGLELGSTTGTVDDFATAGGPWIGARSDSINFSNGQKSHVRIYDHALTPTEVQYLYEIATGGRVVTSDKSANSIEPKLTADVTLDGESATAYVIGSPGTGSEEVQKTALSDGQNDYTFSWSNSHSDFRTLVDADISTVTSRVDVSKLELPENIFDKIGGTVAGIGNTSSAGTIPGLRPTLIDDFERSSLDIYTGDTAEFNISSNYSTSGSKALFTDQISTNVKITTSTGVDTLPTRGDVFEWDTRVVINEQDQYTNYQADIDFGSNEYTITHQLDDNTSSDSASDARIEIIAATSGKSDKVELSPKSTGTHTFSHKVVWGDPTITYRLFEGGSEVANVSIDDTEVDSGDFTWQESVGNPNLSNLPEVYFDNCRITGAV